MCGDADVGKTMMALDRVARLTRGQCEGIFNPHPDVYRTALVGAGRDGSLLPVLCVELHKDRAVDRAGIEADLHTTAVGNELTRHIDRFLFHDDFPVDVRHNAKIFREKLAVWATGRLAL